MSELRETIERLAQQCGGTVSVCVKNVRQALDFGLNANERMKSASTIKVPILIEALRQAREGVLDLDAQCCVPRERCCAGSGVLTHLHDGVAMTLKDLLMLMIIVSDNTATNLAIDAVGVDNVNSTLRGFGCSGMSLGRRMYDWEARDRGLDNFVVAEEMADLLARVAGHEAVGGKWDDLVLSMMRAQQFSDELGLLLPDGVLANKTGQIEGIVHDCGVVSTPEFCYSIAVFTKDAPNAGEANVAIGRISKAVFDAAAAGKSC